MFGSFSGLYIYTPAVVKVWVLSRLLLPFGNQNVTVPVQVTTGEKSREYCLLTCNDQLNIIRGLAVVDFSPYVTNIVRIAFLVENSCFLDAVNANTRKLDAKSVFFCHFLLISAVYRYHFWKNVKILELSNKSTGTKNERFAISDRK